MPSFLASILARLAPVGSYLARYVGPIVLVAFLSYQWGRSGAVSACKRASEEQAVALERAARQSAEEAYERGLKEGRNERRLDQIVRESQGEDGSDDICLTEDILARIRGLGGQ